MLQKCGSGRPRSEFVKESVIFGEALVLLRGPRILDEPRRLLQGTGRLPLQKGQIRRPTQGQCPSNVLSPGLAFDFDEIKPGHPGCTSHHECIGNYDRILCHAVSGVQAAGLSEMGLVGAAVATSGSASLQGRGFSAGSGSTSAVDRGGRATGSSSRAGETKPRRFRRVLCGARGAPRGIETFL